MNKVCKKCNILKDLSGWYIDHIVQLARFNLADRAQLLKTCHYANLQPLCGKDNLRKSNTIA